MYTLRSFSRALPALSLALALAGCATTDDDSLDLGASELDIINATTPDYFRLETIGSGGGGTAAGPYVVSRVNGGTMRCPNGQNARKCTVDDLVLPADCDWECKDGVLSLQGITVLHGAFRTTPATRTSRARYALVAAAAFDTFDATLGVYPVYKLTQRVAPCFRAPCPVLTTLARLNATDTPTQPRSVDFSRAHDPNYVLDASRGIAQMARPEGLIATGTIVSGVFRVDRVWRQESPLADCDTLAAARAHAFPTPPTADEVQLVFATTAEAESYQDPQHRTVKWLVRTENTATAIKFVWGYNDLWAEMFDVSTTTCGVTTTGEH